MKTFESYLDEATEAQARASNPNASPELIRRAAERSQRSAAQRNANQKTSQNNINKGQRSLPPAGGALAKVAPKKTSALANTPKVQARQTQRVRSGSGGDGLANNRGRYSSKPRTAAERITSDKVSNKKSSGSGNSNSASERLAAAQLKDRENAAKKAKFDGAKKRAGQVIKGLGKTAGAAKKLATLPGSGNKVGVAGSGDLKGPAITK